MDTDALGAYQQPLQADHSESSSSNICDPSDPQFNSSSDASSCTRPTSIERSGNAEQNQPEDIEHQNFSCSCDEICDCGPDADDLQNPKTALVTKDSTESYSSCASRLVKLFAESGKFMLTNPNNSSSSTPSGTIRDKLLTTTRYGSYEKLLDKDMDSPVKIHKCSSARVTPRKSLMSLAKRHYSTCDLEELKQDLSAVEGFKGYQAADITEELRKRQGDLSPQNHSGKKRSRVWRSSDDTFI